MTTLEERAEQVAVQSNLDREGWWGKEEAPQLKADIVTAIRAAVAEAVAEERESIAKSAEAAADAWRPYSREFAAFVRARSRGEGEGDIALS